MIAASILFIHLVAAVYAFFKYKKEGVGEGFLAVGFIVIVFSVGWTISTMVAKVVFPSELVGHWIAGLRDAQTSRVLAKELTVDTCSLVLLTVGEIVFYYFYLRSGNRKEKQQHQPAN